MRVLLQARTHYRPHHNPGEVQMKSPYTSFNTIVPGGCYQNEHGELVDAEGHPFKAPASLKAPEPEEPTEPEPDEDQDDGNDDSDVTPDPEPNGSRKAAKKTAGRRGR